MCIYIVDDSPADARILVEGLRRAGVRYRLFGTGDQVLRALAEVGSAPEVEKPRVVVLDLNLPGKNGFEVLEAIRRDRVHGALPIAMLTTSDDPKDRERCAELGANCFHTKPLEFDGWDAIVREILRLAGIS